MTYGSMPKNRDYMDTYWLVIVIMIVGPVLKAVFSDRRRTQLVMLKSRPQAQTMYRTIIDIIYPCPRPRSDVDTHVHIFVKLVVIFQDIEF